MPSENIQVVRRGAEAWARGDIDAMLREYDPQVEIADPERAGGPFVGHQAYKDFFAEWMESWEQYDARVEALVDLGEHVVLFQHHTGRARGSGIVLDQRGALLVRLREGKIVHHRQYTHRAEALADAGLADAESWRVGIETILAGYEAWNRRDAEALMKLMEPDSEFVPIEQSIMPAFTGPAGMREFFESSVDVWEEFVFTPVSFEMVGDAVLVELEARGKARGSGIELQEHWAHVYTQNQGRLRRFSAFSSVDDARAALA